MAKLPRGYIKDWRSLTEEERQVTFFPPARLSVEPSSEWYCDILTHRVGVKLDGREQKRVIEYNVEEGWVRVHANIRRSARVSRNGKVPAFKKHGKVEVIMTDLTSMQRARRDEILAASAIDPTTTP